MQLNLVGSGPGGRQEGAWWRNKEIRRIGVGPAKGEKSWSRRTGGLGGPEALLSMGTGYSWAPFPLPRFQSKAGSPGLALGRVGGGGLGSQVLQSSSMGALDSYTGIITTVMGCG